MATRDVWACLITNPRAGRGGVDLSAVLPILREHGWRPMVRPKLRGGHAVELAREAAQQGFDVIVNCGGDGTLRQIVEGVGDAGVAIGSLPGGTVNLWARELGISRRLEVAARQLVGSSSYRVDAGQVTVNDGRARRFLLMAGLGLDGAVIAATSKPLKNRIGSAAVALAALRALPGSRAVPVEIELDGLRWAGRVWQIVVGNTRRYAGITRATPGALIDDGRLDVCLVTEGAARGAARQAASLLLRQRPSPATSESYRAAAITVRAAQKLPMQLDGGAKRLAKVRPGPDGVVYRIEALPRAVTVLVPRTYNGELFVRGAAAPPLDAEPFVSDARVERL